MLARLDTSFGMDKLYVLNYLFRHTISVHYNLEKNNNDSVNVIILYIINVLYIYMIVYKYTIL